MFKLRNILEQLRCTHHPSGLLQPRHVSNQPTFTSRSTRDGQRSTRASSSDRVRRRLARACAVYQSLKASSTSTVSVRSPSSRCTTVRRILDGNLEGAAVEEPTDAEDRHARLLHSPRQPPASQPVDSISNTTRCVVSPPSIDRTC
jgi:hypothetical protein